MAACLGTGDKSHWCLRVSQGWGAGSAMLGHHAPRSAQGMLQPFLSSQCVFRGLQQPKWGRAIQLVALGGDDQPSQLRLGCMEPSCQVSCSHTHQPPQPQITADI